MTSECDTERDRYDTWPASEIDRLARRLKVLAEYAHARQASAPATGEDTETRAAQVLIAHQRLDIGSCLCGWGVKTGQLGKCHSRHVAGELAAAGVLAVSERHELCPAHPAGPLSNVRYRCLRCEIERLRAELASVNGGQVTGRFVECGGTEQNYIIDTPDGPRLIKHGTARAALTSPLGQQEEQ